MRQHKGSSRRFVDIFASESVADYHIAGRRLKSLANKCRSESRLDQLFVYLTQAATDTHTGACLLAHAVHVSGQLHNKAARVPAGLSRLQSLMVTTLIPNACLYIGSFSSIEVANTLWSIAKLQIEWSDIPGKQQDAILMAVRNMLPSMKAHNVSACWWAFAKLGVYWRTLPPGLCMSMVDALSRQGESLDINDCARVLQAMALMRVTNSRAMQLLVVSLFELSIKLNMGLVSDQLAVCFAYHTLKHRFQLRRLDISHYETNVRANIHASPSRIQLKIQKQLQSFLSEPLELKQEVHLHDVPVDILCDQHKIIVEVDGPYHQAPQKQRSDQAHDHMRALDGYTTVRINLLKFNEKSEISQNHLIHCLALAIESNAMHLIDSEAVSIVLAKKKPTKVVHLRAQDARTAVVTDDDKPVAKRARMVGAGL